MRQLVVAAANQHGQFVAINAPSIAAKSGGISEANIIGRRFWDFCPSSDSRKIRDAFAECLIDGRTPRYTITSEIKGRVEHWDNVLIPVRDAAVIAVAREVFPGKTVEVTPDEISTLKLMLDDNSVEQIAEAMQVQPGTMGQRLKRLREKCGVHTNHGLVAWCIRYGVLK
ncbi:PAS fold-4 [uncultured Caudovirales phage]|uniref:PAS fold-4 n=1 Tax=uncultured Caudovirales phage TaxID=2100421 RepID=A0A6J5RGP7_9CAUD|nr:PAS fold-4 [uncultured Caudovirales phage]